MYRRKAIKSAITSGLFISGGSINTTAKKSDAQPSETLYGDTSSPITRDDIRSANQAAFEQYKDQGGLSSQQSGSVGVLLPAPKTKGEKITVGYHVEIRDNGRVDYFHGEVPQGLDSNEITTASTDGPVTRVHSQMDNHINQSRSVSTLNTCSDNPINDFHGYSVPNEFYDKWGCPQTSGQRVVEGERVYRDEFDYKVEEKQGRLSASEAIVHTKDGNEQWVGCLSDVHPNPGASLEGNQWELNNLEIYHGWGDNPGQDPISSAGYPQSNYGSEGPNSFSIGIGPYQGQLGVSWSDAPKEMSAEEPEGGNLEWDHDWSPTEAAPYLGATSIAKLPNEPSVGDKLLRTTQKMGVIGDGFFGRFRPKATVGRSLVEYEWRS